MTKKKKIKAKIKELRNIQKIDSPSLRATHEMIDDVVEDVLKVLDEPIKINDILNWEEGKAYQHDDFIGIYRILDGKLQFKFAWKYREWKDSELDYKMILYLANGAKPYLVNGAEPYKEKKYYLVIPELEDGFKYFNLNIHGKAFISDTSTTMYVKTQFTEEEIEEIQAKYPKLFSVLEKVEVENHE